MAPVPSVSDLVASPRHAGALQGAALRGEASRPDRLIVRVGVWLDAGGAPVRARFQAATCASLIAYADAACRLIEAGDPGSACAAAALRRHVRDVHPVHLDRADLVARACRAALDPTRSPGDPP